MAANPIDLTTVAAVKSWLSGTGIAPVNTSDDANIQACITAFSAMVLWKTGRGAENGAEPTQSPFTAPQSYTETRDGNGSRRMFLRNYPILSLSSLVIGFWTVPQSLAYGQAGWVIDQSGKSISLRGGSNAYASPSFFSFGYGGTFYKDIQNIVITYTAGFAQIPDDLGLTATKVVSLMYKRKDWIGLRSKTMANGAGTTSYVDYEMEPNDVATVVHYRREALMGGGG
jgi:hypothetical protein